MIARLVRLLPEPDSPTSANVSPGRTKKETSCTVGITIPPRLKPTLMFSTVSVGAVVANAMSVIEPRVEGVAQPVADEVEARHCQRDRDAREDRKPGRGGEILLGVVEHVAPARRRRLNSVAKKEI